MASASTSSTNNSTGITTSAADAKPRIWSLAGTYKGGPLELAAAYEKHTKAYNNSTQGVAALSTAGTTLAVGDYDWTYTTVTYSSNRTKRTFGSISSDIGGYYKNVVTLAPALTISREEMDLALTLLDQLLARVTRH